MIDFDKDVSIEKKNQIQDKAVKLLYIYRRILLSWATGCGKTLASLKMVKLLNEKKGNIKGYVICKEHNHINNWKLDIKEHNMKHSLLLYIDVGLDDYKRVLQMNRDFHEALSDLGIQHTYREHVDKKHDWIYLNQHIKDSLAFIDKHIARPVSFPSG